MGTSQHHPHPAAPHYEPPAVSICGLPGVFSLLSSSSRQEGSLDDLVRRLGLAPQGKPSSADLLKVMIRGFRLI